MLKLVREIERVETTKRKFGDAMRTIKDSIDFSRFRAIAETTLEPTLIARVSETSLSGLRIAGIDGGLVRKQFQSMNLLLTRGVAVVFSFGPEEGPHVEFYPEPFPEPRVTPVLPILSPTELDQMASLERVSTELRVALGVLERFRSNLILLDGSLFYHPRDRPQRGSPVFEKFQEVLALYRRMYGLAMERNTTLVGVVKDGRSTRVTSVLGDILPHIVRDPAIFETMQDVDYRWLLKMSRDCDVLDTFMDVGERTFAFRYSSEINSSVNAPDDLLAWASSIIVTYLKAARDDLPIRIEVLTSPDDPLGQLDRALSAILPLSSQHPEYGVPAPILEADARARITSNESQLIVDRLMAMSGLTYVMLERRRSRNPFSG